MSDLGRRQMEDTIETLTEEVAQLRAERDALLPVVEAARDAKTAIETAPVGPGAGKLMTLLDALDALQPTEGAQP